MSIPAQGAVGAETMTAGQSLDLRDLHAANIARQAEWCPDQVPDLSFRGNELGGECGEAQNVIKKLERERQGWRGSRATKDDLADELADVVICADLCAVTAEIDLGAAVRRKFNATSEKQGLSVFLPLPALASPRADSGERTAGDVLTEACKPWEHYTGEPPDDGSPLSGVFVAGMAYTERLLAKLLGVTHYEGGDGSEDFDSDATQTLRNILTGARLWDANENRPVSATPAQPARPLPDSLRALSEAVIAASAVSTVERLENAAVGGLFHCEADREEAVEIITEAIRNAAQPAGQSAGSGAETDALVDRFSAALKVKLRAAEAKYGWKNGWLKSDWQVECQNGLLRHVGKGDPLDVAAYAAFCWHHGWPSASRRSTDLVTGAVIPTAGAIAAYETRYPDGSLSETSDNTIEAWNRVAAAVCLAEKPAPDSPLTGPVGVPDIVRSAVANAVAADGFANGPAAKHYAALRALDWVETLIAARPAAPEAQGWRERVRHVKCGTEYEVLGEAEAQIATQDHQSAKVCGEGRRILREGQTLTVYRGSDGKLWCRFTDEMRDGRFETITPPSDPAPSGQAEG